MGDSPDTASDDCRTTLSTVVPTTRRGSELPVKSRHPETTSERRSYLEVIPTRLLTVDEVSNLLAVSRGTIYRLIDSGQIRSLKIGGSRRIEPTAVEQFLATRRSAS